MAKQLTVEKLLRARARYIRAALVAKVSLEDRARILAASLSCENFPTPDDPGVYAALVEFRHLRQDARVAAARKVLA